MIDAIEQRNDRSHECRVLERSQPRFQLSGFDGHPEHVNRRHLRGARDIHFEVAEGTLQAQLPRVYDRATHASRSASRKLPNGRGRRRSDLLHRRRQEWHVAIGRSLLVGHCGQIFFAVAVLMHSRISASVSVWSLCLARW